MATIPRTVAIRDAEKRIRDGAVKGYTSETVDPSDVVTTQETLALEALEKYLADPKAPAGKSSFPDEPELS